MQKQSEQIGNWIRLAGMSTPTKAFFNLTSRAFPFFISRTSKTRTCTSKVITEESWRYYRILKSVDIRDTNLKDVGAFVHDTLSAIPKLKSHNKQRNVPNNKIRPHRRCWGVIFRMALVKGYRFTGGGIFRPKPPVFDRSWRSPSKNTVKNSTEDTCSWTRPSKIGKRKVKKPRVFQLFDFNFLVCNIFFCGSAGGLARRRIFEFLDPFSDWFSSFCDSRNTGFYSVFLFSACLTASFKTSKNLVNYAVLCYGVNENIVNTSVFYCFLTLVKKTL